MNFLIILLLYITTISTSLASDTYSLIKEESYSLLEKQLINNIKKNKHDADSYYLLNNIYLLQNKDDLVDSQMEKYYPKIKANTYYKYLFKNLYYKNKINLSGDFFVSKNYNGQNYNLSYFHRFKENNELGVKIEKESRNFNGDKRTANQYKLMYQKRLSYFEKYTIDLGISPENSFLPSYSILQNYYFSINKKNSAFIGLGNNYYKPKNLWFHTVMGGVEHYVDNSIFHANTFLTIHSARPLVAMQVALTQNLTYRSLIKGSIAFGDSIDAAKLFGPYKEYNLKYEYAFDQIKPSIFINHYESNFRLENRIGGAVQWIF